MGEMLDGVWREYCLVAADQLIPMPENVSFEDAASLPVAYGTAHRMLVTHNTVKKGNRVLILGASGGVGTGCVILCKPARSGSHRLRLERGKMAKLKEIGADEAINYTEVDFSKWRSSATASRSGATYDGGVDVGDQLHRRRHLAAVAALAQRGGKLLVCGATAGYDPKEDLRYVWSFELQIIGSNSFYDENLKALMAMIGRARLKPVIDTVVPLEGAAEGLRLIQDRKVIGKVVVTP